ncbi:hypothetical protein J2T14_005133 [Paenibacillus harenae]|nr:hypothetical protein [Paenibacillus harenae]
MQVGNNQNNHRRVTVQAPFNFVVLDKLEETA